MTIHVYVTINAKKERVWQVLTDIDHLSNNISHIEKSDILLRPNNGLVGLKWDETRTVFGDTVTEVKCISAIDEMCRCEIITEDYDEDYTSVLKLEEKKAQCRLSLTFTFHTHDLLNRLKNLTHDLIFRGFIKRSLLADLIDIKRVAEAH